MLRNCFDRQQTYGCTEMPLDVIRVKSAPYFKIKLQMHNNSKFKRYFFLLFGLKEKQ